MLHHRSGSISSTGCSEVARRAAAPIADVRPSPPQRPSQLGMVIAGPIRLEAIERWGAALERGSADEVERLVRESRGARVEHLNFRRRLQVTGSVDSLVQQARLG